MKGARVRGRVEEPGQDAVSPFGDASDASDGGDSSPAPIVLGETAGLGVGAGQQTLAQQAKANMPLEMAPAEGTMLTGSVSIVGGQVWGDGSVGPDTGSFWGGIARTCIFGSVIMLLIFGTFMWSEGGDDWHVEQVQVSWTDESRTDGSFTLPYAPIEECNLYMYNDLQQYYQHEWQWIEVDCDGTLVVNRRADVGYFSGGWESSDNATVTIIFQQAPPYGSHVSASIESRGYSNYVTQHPESITGDGVSTEFTFPVVPSEFESCRFTVHAWSDYQEIDVDVMSERNNNCPAMNLTALIREDAGFIDFETGYGEFDLSSSAPEDLNLWADYEEEYTGSEFARDAGPCFGSLAGLVLGIVWLMQVVNAYKDGKSNKGTGMLVGIIPTFVMMVVFQIALIIIFEF